MSEENIPQEVAEFDINDPSLTDYVPEIDGESVPVQTYPAPPPDGYHYLKARLSTNPKMTTKGQVYLKGEKDAQGNFIEPKVVAVVSLRLFDRETEKEGAYLNTWWPTTQVFSGSKGSQLTAIYYLTRGEPIKSSVPGRSPSLKDIKNAIETLFAEAGEEGVTLLGKTRWVMAKAKVDKNGLPIYKDGSEYPEKADVKGEAKIKKLAALQGISEDRAHVFTDPVSGEERTVGVEIWTLEDPSNFEEA